MNIVCKSYDIKVDKIEKEVVLLEHVEMYSQISIPVKFRGHRYALRLQTFTIVQNKYKVA